MEEALMALIRKAAARLVQARGILFITGAGLSADSGLPTYRGVGGLYEEAETEDGVPIEAALSGRMLASRPEITWKYLSQIEQNCRRAVFNRGHAVIAEMERHFPRVWTLTQNIDGFHAAAGSRNVIEIHGNMRRLRCDACGWRTDIPDLGAVEIPPQCRHCGCPARPDVVFFGETLPDAEVARYDRELGRGFDVCLWVGTTSVFPYIQAPLYEARRRGGLTVEINPGGTEISDRVDIKLPLRAAPALEALWGVCREAEGKGQHAS